MKIIQYLKTKIIFLSLLTFSSFSQQFTNVSFQPYTTTVTNQDELIEQFKDLSAATGYRTRRIAFSNVADAVSARITTNGMNGLNITNLAYSSVVIAGTNATVVTNTIAGTGQKTYTVSALVSPSDVNPPSLSQYAAVKGSDQIVSVSSTNMVTVPELSISLPTGTYEMRCKLFCTNYVPSGGSDYFLFNFAGGVATISTVRLTGYNLQIDSAGHAISSIGAVYSSSSILPTEANFPQDDNVFCIEGILHVTGAGTVIPKVRCGQGGSVATEMRVLHDSYVVYTKVL